MPGHHACCCAPGELDDGSAPAKHEDPQQGHLQKVAGLQFQVPVAVKTSYGSLFSSSQNPLNAAQNNAINGSCSEDPKLSRTRTNSGSTGNLFNTSFAPSLQSHSTSVYTGAGLGLADKTVNTTRSSLAGFNSFSLPLHGYSGQGQVWTTQRVQAFTLGTRRINAMDTPRKELPQGERYNGASMHLCR